MQTSHNLSVTDRLRVGQTVHDNAYAGWHPATVTSIAHSRIGVTYHDEQLPARYAGAVAPHVVRPADGTRLKPAAALSPGDRVLAFDNSHHTVQAAWPGRDGWWVISYADGQYATMPPAAVLRLADPTAPVRDRWSA